LAQTETPSRNHRRLLGFSTAVPIGLLGGLIGLGGAEFRLPVLVGPLAYTPRQAVPLNLALSLITVSVALLTRSQTLPLAQLSALGTVLLTLTLSAVLGAYAGAAWAARLSNQRLKQIIMVLLLLIGAALIIEAFLPSGIPGFIPTRPGWQISSAIVFGIAIGLFSSILGVAGGELIIPTLIFAYGVDIKLAGTASLLISLPTIVMGIARYATRGGYSRKKDFSETVLPMGIGSVIGSILGGLLVGFAPTRLLKIFLGLILGYSAWHIFK